MTLSSGYEVWKNSIFSQSTIQNIGADKYSRLSIALPPLKEQNRIVKFLDQKVSEINQLIEDTKASIEELKAYKQSVISEAVTKGIDSTVEMRDSEVEWIGEIPVGWEVLNPKRVFKERKQRAVIGEEQLTASQKYGIISQKEYMEKENVRVVIVQQDFSILKHVEPRDFVISMRSFQGGLEYSYLSGCISSAYVMLHAQRGISDEYFKWLFKSAPYIDALKSTSQLIRDGQAMRYSNFVQVFIPFPPIEEQDKIAIHLNSTVSNIDSLIPEKEKLITELEAYKKSLIYEYVTGKKEVPSD